MLPRIANETSEEMCKMNTNSTPNSKNPDDSDVVKLLSDIEEELASAWVAGDSSFHERILADDWRVIDITGRILTKADVLKEAFTGERQVTSGRIDQISVRPFGDWAIVTGRTHMTGRYKGEEMEVTLRFTDVFAYREGNWQVVASQATLLKQ